MRKCSICNKGMFEGFMYDDGLYYYCSNKCLRKDFTLEEHKKLYNDGILFWTNWIDEDPSLNEAYLVNKAQADFIIENRKPIGLFYYKVDNTFVGIDNSTGEAFVEGFIDKETCLAWLLDDSLVYHTEIDFGKTINDLKNQSIEDKLNTNGSGDNTPKTFEVIITEELVTSVSINADSKEEAINIAREMYDNGEIILDFDDLNDVNFRAGLL